MACDIFISYRKGDTQFQSDRLHDSLTNHFGKGSVFFDKSQVKPGDKWPEVLKENLEAAKVVLMAYRNDAEWLGENSSGIRRIDSDNDWVRKELEFALKNNKVIIPVFFGENFLPPVEELKLPENLQPLHNCQGRTIRDNDWDSDLALLIDDLEERGVRRRNNSRLIWEYVAGAGVVVGILAGIFQIADVSIKDIFGGGPLESFTVTVFVHGKKGKDERILKNQGQVMLGLRTNEMPSGINEKGEATFKEIPMGFKGKLAPIRIEHPQPYRATYPDSLYLLEPNAVLYLEVALEGMNRIFGKVMDFETELWLDSVRVSIENIATYTDQYGWFELFIPEDRQRKFQRVSFYKGGYQIEDLDSIPVHTQQQIDISLKKAQPDSK